MAGAKKFEDPEVVHVKIERKKKAVLVEHCNRNGLMFSGLIRRLLDEYAEKEGLTDGK